MSTIASQIADMFDNDGMNFELDNGRTLHDVCKANAALAFGCQHHVSGADRYVFSDGTSIVILGDGWDIGFTEEEADEDETKRFAWPETWDGTA